MTELPGIDSNQVIPSSPQLIYEGCSGPGKKPWVIHFIDWIKNMFH